MYRWILSLTLLLLTAPLAAQANPSQLHPSHWTGPLGGDRRPPPPRPHRRLQPPAHRRPAPSNHYRPEKRPRRPLPRPPGHLPRLRTQQSGPQSLPQLGTGAI